MADRDIMVANGGGRVGWFAAGALAVAGAIALFLYADGYFDQSSSVELKGDVPNVDIIEGQ
ncbi:MAG: hypothetical protein H0T56_06495 [Pseudaminobacter sp.]|nr:hypothetical protein [Pseudaminobacter sp.]